MIRQIAALFTAALAAPYLITTGLVLEALLEHGRFGAAISPANYILLVGTAGALAFCVPLVLVSGTIALCLRISGLYSRANVLWCAAILGSTCSGWVFRSTGTALLAGTLAGAICGWIYWRIAIRGSARAPVT